MIYNPRSMKRVEVLERIRKSIMPPQFDDPEKNRRAQLLNFIAWSGILILAYLIILRAVPPIHLLNRSSLVLEALFLVILILSRFIQRGHIHWTGIILVLSSWLAL